MTAPCDALVIGAGHGGLGAALRLAQLGARVTLFEALTYPGGCAATFEKGGHRFEAGATLCAGLGEGQLLGRLDRDLGLGLQLADMDPVIELRAPGLRLPIPPERQRLVEALCALPGAPREGLLRFFELQGRVADLLWQALDHPERLPPFGPGGLRAWLPQGPAALGLLPLLGRPLGRLVQDCGLADFAPLTTWLDATCQITVQVGWRQAEAPLALSALDFPFRGARHVQGGLGQLARALARAIEGLGGQLRFADRARSLRREGGQWVLQSRKGEHRAPLIFANLLPADLGALLDPAEPRPARLDQLEQRLEQSWSAVCLYLARRRPGPPHHVEIVQDPDLPYIEGNHLFASVGEEGDVTVSTHVSPARLAADPAAQSARIQAHMREGLARHAPELLDGAEQIWPASPRTWARFTRRSLGRVGGVPRHAGLSHYADLWPRPVLPGLWLVGDSVPPGQSILATLIGGMKAAEAALASRPPA